MPTPRSHVRLIIELESAVYERLTQLIDQQITPIRTQIVGVEHAYQDALTAWRERGEALVREHQGAPGDGSGSIKRIFDAHSAQRPKRPMGRPRARVNPSEIFAARNEVIAALIIAATPKATKKLKPIVAG